jgi:hypothetical protein
MESVLDLVPVGLAAVPIGQALPAGSGPPGHRRIRRVGGRDAGRPVTDQPINDAFLDRRHIPTKDLLEGKIT